jgi:hypothetical protein
LRRLCRQESLDEQPGFAELLAVGVERLGDAVGIEVDAVAGLEGDGGFLM